MSSIVTMSQTVGNYISGSTYRVRSKTAEILVANSQATKLTKRGPNSGLAADKEGK